MQIYQANGFSLEDLDLKADRPTILVVTDSPGVHTGLAKICRNVWTPLYETGKYNIVQLAWWHRDPMETVPWPLLYTLRNSNGLLDPQDKYGNVSMNHVFKTIKPDLVWCFTPDTEVVTRDGIKNITEIKPGDLALSVNPDTGEVSYKPVVAIQTIDYKGDLISIKARGVDFSVTPEHKMLLRNRFSKRYTWSTAAHVESDKVETYRYLPRFRPIAGKVEEVFNLYEHLGDLQRQATVCVGKFSGTADLRAAEDWIQSFGVQYDVRNLYGDSPYIELTGSPEDVIRSIACVAPYFDLFMKASDQSKARGGIPVLYNTDEWLALLGWYISEGNRESQGIRLSQRDQSIRTRGTSHKEEMVSLIDRIGLSHSTDARRSSINSKILCLWMEQVCGAKAGSKRIPEFVFEYDHTHLRSLFETLMMGDGHENGSTYTTISPQLSDSFLRLCFHLGIRCSRTWVPAEKSGCSDVCKIYITRSRDFASFNHTHTSKQAYTGKVYCCTVADNHTLLAGRNGKFQFIGQCSGDPWMIAPLTSRRQIIPGPIISYLAVDGGPLDPGGLTTNTVGWHEVCSNSDAVVPYLPWGQNLMSEVFPETNIMSPIPVGIDAKIFKPLTDEERIEARKIYFASVPHGAGLFTSISRNQFRKNLPENIRALYFLRSGKYSVCPSCGRYNLWRRDYVRCKDMGPEPRCKFCSDGLNLRPGKPRSNLTYYMHVPLDEAMDDSWRLPDLLNQFGIIQEDKLRGVLVNDALESTHGVSDADLAGYLACCDAYAMPSMGEGFGMPYLEALACGTPVVATDYSAHPDYLRGVGRLVPCSYISCEPATNYWRGLVDPDAWAQALDETVFGKPDREACRARALEYDWQNIWPQWEALIDRCLHEGRSIGVWSQQIQGV